MSKGWKLIQRFSEDLDVVIDRRFPGFTGEAAPETAPSQKQRARRLDALRVACQQYVRRTLLPELDLALGATLIKRDRWPAVMDPADVDDQSTSGGRAQ